jgi:hypothetical protein
MKSIDRVLNEITQVNSKNFYQSLISLNQYQDPALYEGCDQAYEKAVNARQGKIMDKQKILLPPQKMLPPISSFTNSINYNIEEKLKQISV